MPISPECEAGCMSFDGGEVKHHRDCTHYPESLTKLWHDTEADYVAEIDRLRAALKPFAEYMRTPEGRLDEDNHGKPLADEQGVGWVYLTHGDFRRAEAAIKSKEGQGDG